MPFTQTLRYSRQLRDTPPVKQSPTNVTHLIKIASLIVLMSGAYLAVRGFDLRKLLSPDQVIAHLNAAGPFAPVVFVLLMATTVVISPIPSLPLDLAAGATFGLGLGTAYAVIGAEIGAVLSFLIGRVLGREALARLLRMDIRFCERCSDRHLTIFVFLARLFPIFSFDLVSYGAGLTNMSIRAFAVATLLGMIPPTFALTYAGRSLVSGEWLVIFLGLFMVVFILLVPKLATRYYEARWVRLLRGEAPVVTDQEARPTAAEAQAGEPTHRCSSCGGPMD